VRDTVAMETPERAATSCTVTKGCDHLILRDDDGPRRATGERARDVPARLLGP
jgi:hypothetical protein